MLHLNSPQSVFKATKKQIACDEITFEELKAVFKQIGIDNINKFREAKNNGSLKVPTEAVLRQLCVEKTGKSLQAYFELKGSKLTFKEKLSDQIFITQLREWCKVNNINSISDYVSAANRPVIFPTYERIRQLYGEGYSQEKLGIGQRYLGQEEAREVCKKFGILRSQHYLRFSQKYNENNEVKLPSDFSRFYETTWSNFIKLSPTQRFLGRSMSNLELFTYKLLFDRGITFETEKSFPECRSKKPLPFDFYLPNHNGQQILIELDGEQHRNGPSNNLFYSATTQKHDQIKTDFCSNNGLRLIRLNNLIDIEPILMKELQLEQYPKTRDLDWSSDLMSEDEVLKSKLPKAMKARLLLLMGETGKSDLSDLEIMAQTKIKQPSFSQIINELRSIGLINRPCLFRHTEDKYAEIVKLYIFGKTVTDIVKITGYKNRTYIVKRIKDAGVVYRSRKTKNVEPSCYLAIAS